MMYRFGAALAALALSGCTPALHAVVTSAAPTSIVYRVPADKVDHSRRLASRHCADHNKKARFEQVTDAGRDTVVAAFRCV